MLISQLFDQLGSAIGDTIQDILDLLKDNKGLESLNLGGEKELLPFFYDEKWQMRLEI